MRTPSTILGRIFVGVFQSKRRRLQKKTDLAKGSCKNSSETQLLALRLPLLRRIEHRAGYFPIKTLLLAAIVCMYLFVFARIELKNSD
jgi:hypothetical protein